MAKGIRPVFNSAFVHLAWIFLFILAISTLAAFLQGKPETGVKLAVWLGLMIALMWPAVRKIVESRPGDESS